MQSVAAVDEVTAGMRSTCDGTVLEMNMAMKVPFATQIVQQVRMRVIRILRSCTHRNEAKGADSRTLRKTKTRPVPPQAHVVRPYALKPRVLSPSQRVEPWEYSQRHKGCRNPARPATATMTVLSNW